MLIYINSRAEWLENKLGGERIHGGTTITASEGTCHAHSEADGHCEDAKQQQVDWVLLAVEVQREHHCIQKIDKRFISYRLYSQLQFTKQPSPILQ